MWRTLRKSAMALLTTTVVGTAAAAGYPERPVRMIVPTPPGGGSDTAARIIAPKLSEILGQQFVVDNRGGAAGRIGATIAAKSPANGYTLMFLIATQISDAAVVTDMPYDAQKDFSPVSHAVAVPGMLFAHPSLAAENVRELIALAKPQPGKLQYASGSVGGSSHLAMELFLHMTSLRMVNVPYKGVGPALADVYAGQVALMIGNMMSALPHVRAGKLRAYGITSPARSSAAPEIPTIAEAGVPGYEADNWSGLVAPAGTPRDIIATLHAALTKALQDPAVRKRFAMDGAEPRPSPTPQAFGTFVANDLNKWKKLVKDANIRVQ